MRNEIKIAGFVISLCSVLIYCPILTFGQTSSFKPIQGEIKNGNKATHSFTIPANKTVIVQVNQKGLDVIVRAFAPNGKKLAGVDSPIGDYGTETLWFITSNEGIYKLEIEPFDDNGSGVYEISLMLIRPTLPQDREIIADQERLQNGYNNLADAIQKGSNSVKSTAKSPTENKKSTSNIPTGATALCNDGTYSYSANRRGTCSHHGGVARWLR